MKSICLNMIVKNEKHVIRRCLEAVKKYIDYWVIVDTGSSDGTQDLIRECLKSVPGELYERPWRNFEQNRNEALRLAEKKAEYILFVDADEVLHFSDHFDQLKLRKDYYMVKTVAGQQEFYIAKLIRDDSLWNWKGVIHEFIQHTGDATGETLPEIWTESVQDGARSLDQAKTAKDIQVLQKAIQEEPTNARYTFYLAQTYMGCKDYANALRTYKKRVELQGDFDETFWSFFCIGLLQELLELNPAIYVKSYDKAHQFDSSRAEPLERIANYYFQNDQPSMAYSLMKYAQTLPKPKPLTCGYYPWVYEFAVYSICADCAMDLKRYNEAEAMYKKILHEIKPESPPGLEEHLRKQLEKLERIRSF